MTDTPGRTCPIRYRYGAEAIAAAPEVAAQTLYVVGGLYGNVAALDEIERMAQAESGPVTICFNGDFNWFNVDAPGFAEINRRVLQHHAILGNVEAELGADADEAGCGCAYPDSVDAAIVERSNRIHARLKAQAAQHPAIVKQLAQLAMFRRYRVGSYHIGIVHGDADSLAGWRFDPAEMAAAKYRDWLEGAFARAQVEVFASSHTCAAGMQAGAAGLVINNGAAGMANAPTAGAGLITRISLQASPHAAVHGQILHSQEQPLWVEALAVNYDALAWRSAFLRNWPAGSDAYLSYFSRIQPAT